MKHLKKINERYAGEPNGEFKSKKENKTINYETLKEI